MRTTEKTPWECNTLTFFLCKWFKWIHRDHPHRSSQSRVSVNIFSPPAATKLQDQWVQRGQTRWACWDGDGMDWNTPHTSIFHERDGKPNRETGGNDLWLVDCHGFPYLYWFIGGYINPLVYHHFPNILKWSYEGGDVLFSDRRVWRQVKTHGFPWMPAYLDVNRLVLGFLTDPHLIKLGLLVLTHRHNLFI